MSDRVVLSGVDRVAGRVVLMVAAVGDGCLSWNEVRCRTASRDRGLLEAAVRRAVDDGRLVVVSGVWYGQVGRRLVVPAGGVVGAGVVAVADRVAVLVEQLCRDGVGGVRMADVYRRLGVDDRREFRSALRLLCAARVVSVVSVRMGGSVVRVVVRERVS
jgi:hypothetical protein